MHSQNIINEIKIISQYLIADIQSMTLYQQSCCLSLVMGPIILKIIFIYMLIINIWTQNIIFKTWTLPVVNNPYVHCAFIEKIINNYRAMVTMVRYKLISIFTIVTPQ